MRRELEPWLTGRCVLAADLVDAVPGPKYAGLGRAVGRRVASVGRHGKFLLLPLERAAPLEPAGDVGQSVVDAAHGAGAGGVGVRGVGVRGEARDVLVLHLGMTGVISAEAPPSHLRVRLLLDGPDPRTLYFRDVRRFGRFLVAPGGDFSALPTLRRAGPDALSSDFAPEAFARSLAGTRVAIKTALMSQRPVAGVGNIYADEALWRVGVHPMRPGRSLRRREVTALHGAIRDVLAASLEAQGTTLYDYRTVNGQVGAYGERLAVYGRAGRACGRCGATIVRIVVGARGTHVCPRCQSVPRAASRGRRR